MGKAHNKRLPVARQGQSDGSSASTTTFLRRGCRMTLLTPKCAVVLLLGVASFLSACFSILPIRYRHAGFDVQDSFKLAALTHARRRSLSVQPLAPAITPRPSAPGVTSCVPVYVSATVQAYFELHKPVAEYIPYITRLEYDINGEIGVPYSKAGVSDPTNVVFGFLFDSIDNSMYPVSLSVLKSSFVDLFLRQYNLTLTSSIFGSISSFEILKFPGGITIIPEPDAMILQIPRILFNFTLNNSIYDIKENILELKEQLGMGLRLMPSEVVVIQVTNMKGSTKDPPVTLEASVMSDIGTLQPQRLKQIARIITRSPPAENLGLNHTIFGKVKEISLSSILKHPLHIPPPIPSPCPSPSPSPEHIPSMSPSFSPSIPPKFRHSHSPYPSCYTSSPSDAGQTFAPTPPPISNPPENSVTLSNQHCVPTDPPGPPPTSHPCQIFPDFSPYNHFEPPLAGPAPHVSPGLSPLASFSHASRGLDERSGNSFMSTPHVSSSFKSISYDRAYCIARLTHLSELDSHPRGERVGYVASPAFYTFNKVHPV